MEDILGDLRRLEQYAAGLQELMGEFQRAAPARSEGADRSGMVRAVLGPDGLPEAIRVSAQWRDRLAAESFGGAVVGACEAAAQDRGEAWSQTLQRAGWQQRLDRLGTEPNGAAAAGLGQVPAAFQRAGRDIKPRPLNELAEAVISALDALSAPAAQPQTEPPRGTGANLQHTLAVTLTLGGQVTCEADPRWVSHQTGAQLSGALSAALAAARGSLASASQASRAAVPPGAQQLMDETLAALDDAVRPTET
jgi:hypothetical protein